MSIPLFLSYPKPFLRQQQVLIQQIQQVLVEQGFELHTIGMNEPVCTEVIDSIKELVFRCDGMLMIAFRRTWLKEGCIKKNSDLGQASTFIKEEWLTSIWCQIEAAMAFQRELPILLLCEEGVRKEGLLECNKRLNVLEFRSDEDITTYRYQEEWRIAWQNWRNEIVQVRQNPAH